MFERRWNEVTPPAPKLLEMYESGMSYARIGAKCGVSGQAVREKILNYKKRAGLDASWKNCELIVWDLNPKHVSLSPTPELLALDRKLKGQQLTLAEQAGARWLTQLLTGADAVLTYDFERGYLLAPRTDGDGAAFVRRTAVTEGYG